MDDSTMSTPDVPSGEQKASSPGPSEPPPSSVPDASLSPSKSSSHVAISHVALDAYEAFYRDFIARLVTFLVVQGACLSDAVDIAQETMIDAYRSWTKIDFPQAWTKRVASRKYARRITRIEEPAEPTDLSPLLSSELDLSDWEERHEVLRILAVLPPRQRQVMAWRYDGYTTSEIAIELNMSNDAVRANLTRARRALAAHLGLPEGGQNERTL